MSTTPRNACRLLAPLTHVHAPFSLLPTRPAPNLRSDGPSSYGEITIDDGSGPTQLEDSILDSDAHIMDVLGVAEDALVGTMIYSITGVVKYSYGSYEIHPRDADDIVFEAPPEPTPMPEPEIECPPGCMPARRSRNLLFGSYPETECPMGCMPMRA